MVENKKRIQFKDSTVETQDEDFDGPGLAPYRYVRSRAAKADFHSDHSDGPDQRDLENLLGRRRKAIVSPRTLKTGVLTASAIAIFFALFFEETTRSVLANAKASFSGMQLRQSDAAPASPAPQPLRD